MDSEPMMQPMPHFTISWLSSYNPLQQSAALAFGWIIEMTPCLESWKLIKLLQEEEMEEEDEDDYIDLDSVSIAPWSHVNRLLIKDHASI